MPLKFRKQASKSLQKISAEDTHKIKDQLKYLLGAIEEKVLSLSPNKILKKCVVNGMAFIA
jgi:mRNA-degrading endonuclease RelE of RelBE toxin-antitoxin system